MQDKYQITQNADNNKDENTLQLYYLEKVKKKVDEYAKKIGHKPTSAVITFGCQMNARDSEKLSGILEEAGFLLTESEEADFVIYNTCTVRDNANQRVYGRLGYLHNLKDKNHDKMIALCGCMMQEATVLEKIKKSYSFVNLIFGTHNIYKFPELLYHMFTSKEMIIDIWSQTDRIIENLPVERKYSFKSGINIMFGCNNFCTYCIVPYVRGRERSRTSNDIINEIKDLVKDGVVEIMLLGQNVNSYGKGLEEKITFAQLLQKITEIEGLERIRFMTSHPKDLSEELIRVMAENEKICKHIHLPVQSGSNRILKEMNRCYTREHYLELVGKIRKAIPDIAITTDLIIGFPGETEEDVDDTIRLIEEAQFDNAFTFIYSKRTGTPAAAMENQVSEELVKHNFNRVLETVQNIAHKQTGKLTGNIENVLVEEMNEQDSTLVTGKLSNNTTVHFPGCEEMIGKIYPVRLLECKGFYYFGERVK